jgi:hypothetical protein
MRLHHLIKYQNENMFQIFFPIVFEKFTFAGAYGKQVWRNEALIPNEPND